MIARLIISSLILFAVSGCGRTPVIYVPDASVSPTEVEKVLKEPLVEDCNVFGSFGEYYTQPLGKAEKEELVGLIGSVAGVKYVWGGQNPEEGLDCSGLIVWAYEKLGFIGFRKDAETVFDVTSYEMFDYNVDSGSVITDMSEFVRYETGDFLFFDINSDGRIDHVAIFMHYDEQTETVWIWDASTNKKGVAYRPVTNILKKNPRMGRPLMLRDKPASVVSADVCGD